MVLWGTMGCNIIIVEDYQTIRELLKMFAERVHGCKVVAEARDGLEAIDLVTKVHADLMLLDLSMPRLDGIKVLQEVKKISAIKVLVVTMHADQERLQQALDNGADGICVKDAGSKAIEKAILEILGGGRPIYTSA